MKRYRKLVDGVEYDNEILIFQIFDEDVPVWKDVYDAVKKVAPEMPFHLTAHTNTGAFDRLASAGREVRPHRPARVPRRRRADPQLRATTRWPSANYAAKAGQGAADHRVELAVPDADDAGGAGEGVPADLRERAGGPVHADDVPVPVPGQPGDEPDDAEGHPPLRATPPEPPAEARGDGDDEADPSGTRTRRRAWNVLQTEYQAVDLSAIPNGKALIEVERDEPRGQADDGRVGASKTRRMAEGVDRRRIEVDAEAGRDGDGDARGRRRRTARSAARLLPRVRPLHAA